jgi:hypothetical protein
VRDLIALAAVIAQIALLIGLLELVVGWWRVRRALDDLHAMLEQADDELPRLP